MNADERAVELRAKGLTLSQVSEVLNNEGYRMKMGGRFDKEGRGAWNYSTYKSGERCPRSGFWDTTCPHYQGGMVYYSSGEVFPDCPASCDHCKWEIIPTSDERTTQIPPEESRFSNINMGHAKREFKEAGLFDHGTDNVRPASITAREQETHQAKPKEPDQNMLEILERQEDRGLENVEARLNQRIDEIERVLKEDVAVGVSCIYSMIVKLGERLGISEDDLLE